MNKMGGMVVYGHNLKGIYNIDWLIESLLFVVYGNNLKGIYNTTLF